MSPLPTARRDERRRCTPFALSESTRPGWREIRVEGELDLAVAGRFKVVLDRAAAGDTDTMVDLGRCEFLDSSGLALLVRARERMASEGCRLCVRNPSQQVLRLLSVTGLVAAGLIVDDVEEARDGDVAIC